MTTTLQPETMAIEAYGRLLNVLQRYNSSLAYWTRYRSYCACALLWVITVFGMICTFHTFTRFVYTTVMLFMSLSFTCIVVCPNSRHDFVMSMPEAAAFNAHLFNEPLLDIDTELGAQISEYYEANKSRYATLDRVKIVDILMEYGVSCARKHQPVFGYKEACKVKQE